MVAHRVHDPAVVGSSPTSANTHRLFSLNGGAGFSLLGLPAFFGDVAGTIPGDAGSSPAVPFLLWPAKACGRTQAVGVEK